jgi:dienelactone hydrolase
MHNLSLPPFCRWLVALALLCFLGAALAVAPPRNELADRLARLDVGSPPEERKALAGMISDAIQRRRQELNDRNTAAWQAVKGRAEWEGFRNSKLEALRASLGQFPPAPKALKVRITGTIAGDRFRIDNLVFESRPGLWVTANLYRPAKARPSMPGILICHSHHTPKEHGELQDMGMTWARAGCLVLVMDQLGHGERRRHPFVDATSYPKKYRVSRQDYFFRYDSGMQLHLIGDSLIGWMVWDLMRGADLLLAEKGIDPKRIILLGSVAGGGDPAAVAGALDARITAVVPFNFGGPSPSPLYPFPPEKEPRWNYAGGGSWESTRNLRRSAADGFLPWVIVAGAAPRRLVYAHEFAWYREGDPVWKRLQKIYEFYETEDRLASTFGKGDVRKRPPAATHCTHIGAVHRKSIHEAFSRWFDIDVPPGSEYSKRLPPEKLRCWTPKALRDLRPRKLTELLGELADERLNRARRREQLRAEWDRALGDIQPILNPKGRRLGSEKVGGATVERVLLATGTGIRLPLLLLLPPGAQKRPPVVVAVSQAGKSALLRQRAAEVAALLEGGVAVCLPDVRGTGESGLGKGRGRTSRATALSSSQLMLGETMVGAQLRDLRTVLSWLRARNDVDGDRVAIWGDSLAPVNPARTNYIVPRDDDAALPAQAEPLGGLLALLAGLYENGVKAVLVRGGLVGFRSVLDSHLVLVPHDVVVPGLLTIGDLDDMAAALAPKPLRLEGIVDGGNRQLGEKQVRQAYRRAIAAYRDRKAPAAIALGEKGPAARWLVDQLRK